MGQDVEIWSHPHLGLALGFWRHPCIFGDTRFGSGCGVLGLAVGIWVWLWGFGSGCGVWVWLWGLGPAVGFWVRLWGFGSGCGVLGLAVGSWGRFEAPPFAAAPLFQQLLCAAARGAGLRFTPNPPPFPPVFPPPRVPQPRSVSMGRISSSLSSGSPKPPTSPLPSCVRYRRRLPARPGCGSPGLRSRPCLPPDPPAFLPSPPRGRGGGGGLGGRPTQRRPSLCPRSRATRSRREPGNPTC